MKAQCKELQETKRTAEVELLRALEKERQASELKEQRWARREEDWEEAKRGLVQQLEEARKRSRSPDPHSPEGPTEDMSSPPSHTGS